MPRRLGTYLDALQTQGTYAVRREELERQGYSRIALKNALRRLAAKGRVAVPHRGFYVLVPLEYRAAGAPPAPWFVDDLMAFLARPYYVGLLSAAAIHGAGHQAVQELQVVTTRPLRSIEVGRTRLRFFVKRGLERTPCTRVKTDTGSMAVSTPEATALDLVRYVAPAGHLSNVATVLSELAEQMAPGRLSDALVEAELEVAHGQRLGYLLERVERPELARAVADWLASRRPRAVPLNPHRSSADCPKVLPWKILENEVVEAEA